jgi:enoyl-CoA hydratase/carnithine racemase
VTRLSLSPVNSISACCFGLKSKMASEKIVVTEENGIATLTLNRPERENAVDGEMMEAMVESLSAMNAAGNSRILLVRGMGEHFCAGRDPGGAAPKNAAEWSRVLEQIVRTNQALAAFPGVSLAVVKGKAHGFGFGIALQSDITLAADDARFGFPEIRGGFPPTIVMSYLSRWVSRKKAFEWVITGDEMDAREAERQGVVNRVYLPTEIDAAARQWVEKLVQLKEPALKACKAFFRDTAHLHPDDAYRYGVSLLANFNASRSS